ncbi:MAG: hypothetical protein DRH44_04430 [Candidatus Coatesbacteria bacterium]|nr:MAG: hypothetical protein DRH49_05220 [Candidatus Coatesbacteria bacterium]RLC43681.1 MAG: hypothetical protein DRH44_04430 [Candidatus Coatesbacteria bacterium]
MNNIDRIIGSIYISLLLVASVSSISLALPQLTGSSWLWVYGEYLDTETIKEIAPDIIVLDPDLYTENAISDLNEADITTLAHIPIGMVFNDSPLWFKVNFRPWILGVVGKVRLGHAIRVWQCPGWRNELGDYIEEDVMTKGFDGIFIDAELPYRMYEEHRSELLDLISDVVDRFRGDFIDSPIVVFGGGDILKRDDIVCNIDGFAMEGVWWDNHRVRTGSRTTEAKTRILKAAQGYGLKAFTVEYPDLPGDRIEVESEASALDFVLYIPSPYWSRY